MKYLSVFLSVLLLFSLVSCSDAEPRYDYKNSNEGIKVWSMGADYEADIEQSNAYRAIWDSLEWEKNGALNSYNFMFFDGQLTIYYDSIDGIFYDMTNNQYAILSEETNKEVRNSIKDLTFIQSHGDVFP